MTRQDELSSRLSEALSPIHLEVINESHMHSVPPGSETHFRVVVASGAFEGKSRIDRHRAVQRALGEAFRAGLHALTIAAFSPSEWAAQPEVAKSPACLGGSKAERS
ncbi:MAG: BolA family transcriptional regulator [Polyangiaceae bacterium]|nr:BolA family transcriptional regulator [Polyangiaceae bacterium]